MKKYSIIEIAKLAEVSPASVSRVMNGLPGVKKENRNRILKIIEETGYQPNSIASSLSRGKTNIVGVILGDIRNPFYSDIAYNIQKSLEQANYQLMLFNSEYDENKELEYVMLSKDFSFAGIIMISALNSEVLNRSLCDLDCPVVLLNRSIENFNGSVVLLDNFSAGYSIARYLIELGHQNIAFLAGPKNSSASSARLKGFKEAMLYYSLPFKEEFIYQGDLKMESGYQVGLSMFSTHSDIPSAIICGNDLMAIGFLDACKEKGIQVPEQISITGFDDIDFAKIKGIDLTTVRQPPNEMGTKAVEFLLEKIKDKTAPNMRYII